VWQEFVQRDYPDIILDLVPDVQSGLAKVSFGHDDAFIENIATAIYYIEKQGVTNLQVTGETGYFTRLSFAVRNDWQPLQSILSKALASIAPSQRDALLTKWIHLETRQSVFAYKTFWLAFGTTVAIALAVILLMVAWSQTLRRQVGQRTAALSAELAERARVEEALRESERRYRFLFEASPAGALIMAADGTISGISKSLADSLGYRPDEIIGRLAAEFVVEAEREEQIARLRRRVQNLQTEQAEVSVCARDGSTRTILFSAGQTMLRENGKPDSVLVTGIDITDRKKAEMLAWQREQDLVRADKLSSLGTLVSGVAHEINNPNNFIILNAGNIRDVWASASPILESVYNTGDRFDLAGIDFCEVRKDVPRLIKGIMDGAERIRVIVENLKDFVRPVSPALNQSVDLNRVVEAAQIILANMIKKSCDRFEVCLAEQAPVCMGNFQKLEQVVINLVANACQALPDRSRGIRVSTGSIEGTVTLEVADEGSGIAEEHLSKIFDPFFTTKRDSGGTGLGLSISYSIVNEHNGNLTVSSVVGRGTVARLRLPALRTSHGESA
jgi:two-component system, NtrC family, sensor kinase